MTTTTNQKGRTLAALSAVNAEPSQTELLPQLPALEVIQRELASAKSVEDFFGKQGIFARLFAHTVEQLLEAEMTEHLGYTPYAVEGRNSGNSRNGKRPKKLRTSGGEITIAVPRDRNSEFEPKVLAAHQRSTTELEDKIIYLYGKGVTTRDIQQTLAEIYGVEVSPTTISAITDKVTALAEAWQNRELAAIYPIIYLDAIHVKLRHEGKVESIAVYNVLGVDLEGRKDVLGHWIGTGGEGANFWLSVVKDLQARGVKDVLLACIDGLAGFREAITAVFPQVLIQRCIIHQIRNSLKYVSWRDRKTFASDLKTVYTAVNREQGELALLKVAEKWSKKYPMAVACWERDWEDLATFFDFPLEIRRLIYTTNSVEGYHRQVRAVIKTKASFPTGEAVRKILFLADRDITLKWTMPLSNWANILNQLAIRFEGRFAI
jgi:transposase-like protein